MKFKQLFGFSDATQVELPATLNAGSATAWAGDGQWCSRGISVVGHRRKINEDAFLERSALGLWMVADGMGGHHAGDVASRALVDALAAVVPAPELEVLSERVMASINEVNQHLHRLAHENMGGQIVGSTVVAFLTRGGRGMAIWAGDSRLYRYRQGRLEQLTRDHSLLDELVAAGLMSPEQAQAEGNGNIITRAVGADAGLELDVLRFEVWADDVYLLCSDGLTKELNDSDIASLLNRGTLDSAAQGLIDAALARGGRDNITVILARPEPPADDPTQIG